jgi:hypothetical protein
MKTPEEIAAEAAEQAKQEAAAQAASESAKAAGGDKTKALQEEREKRKAAQAEAQALKAELARIQGGGNGDAAGDPDMEKMLEQAMDINEEDLLGDPKAIRAKIAKGLAAGIRASQAKTLQTLSSAQAIGEIDKMVAKYAIYADPDETLARHAQASVAMALRSLPKGSSLQQIEEVIAETAKEFSKYKVTTANPAAASARQAPLATASGGADVTAVRDSSQKPTNWEDAGQKARALASKVFTTLTGGK